MARRYKSSIKLSTTLNVPFTTLFVCVDNGNLDKLDSENRLGKSGVFTKKCECWGSNFGLWRHHAGILLSISHVNGIFSTVILLTYGTND